MAASLSDAAAERIAILPLGPVDQSVVQVLARQLARRFGVPVAMLREQPVPEYAYRKSRGQYDSPTILDSLLRKERRGRLLAVVDADLYADGLNFVFGQADMEGGVAVIALARLREEFWGRVPNRNRFLSRVVREAVHELGHTCGLGHCSNPSCVMFFSNRLADTDRKSSDFCSGCRQLLGRTRRRGR